MLDCYKVVSKIAMGDFGFPFEPKVTKGSTIFVLECLGPVKNDLIRLFILSNSCKTGKIKTVYSIIFNRLRLSRLWSHIVIIYELISFLTQMIDKNRSVKDMKNIFCPP